MFNNYENTPTWQVNSEERILGFRSDPLAVRADLFNPYPTNVENRVSS